MQGYAICGVLVHVRPDSLEQVKQQLGRVAGVEVHGANPDGRMVVTVEPGVAGNPVDTIAAFHDIKGVLSASVIYEHSEIDEPRRSRQHETDTA